MVAWSPWIFHMEAQGPKHEYFNELPLVTLCAKSVLPPRHNGKSLSILRDGNSLRLMLERQGHFVEDRVGGQRGKAIFGKDSLPRLILGTGRCHGDLLIRLSQFICSCLFLAFWGGPFSFILKKLSPSPMTSSPFPLSLSLSHTLLSHPFLPSQSLVFQTGKPY